MRCTCLQEARKSQARDAIDAARSAMYSAPSSNTMSVLRREHALCFMHRATLRSAGLHFTQVFNGDLLNKQLPIDLPHKALVKLLALFRRCACVHTTATARAAANCGGVPGTVVCICDHLAPSFSLPVRVAGSMWTRVAPSR